MINLFFLEQPPISKRHIGFANSSITFSSWRNNNKDENSNEGKGEGFGWRRDSGKYVKSNCYRCEVTFSFQVEVKTLDFMVIMLDLDRISLALFVVSIIETVKQFDFV
jgi:hypothetical protein